MTYFSLPSDPQSDETFKSLVDAIKEHWREHRRKMYQDLSKDEAKLNRNAEETARSFLNLFAGLRKPMGDHQAWAEAWREVVALSA